MELVNLYEAGARARNDISQVATRAPLGSSLTLQNSNQIFPNLHPLQLEIKKRFYFFVLIFIAVVAN